MCCMTMHSGRVPMTTVKFDNTISKVEGFLGLCLSAWMSFFFFNLSLIGLSLPEYN